MSVPNPATTEWVPLQGTRLEGMTYWGTYEASRTYNDGDCAIAPNGVLYMCVKDGTVGITPSDWPGRSGTQGAKGDAGAQGLPGAGIPMPVVNGQWVKGSGGAAVWSVITPSDIDGANLVVADTSWKLVTTFVNGWSNYSGFPPVRYRKLASGLVVLSGLMNAGTQSTVAFTLPVGYRPDIYRHIICAAMDTVGIARISTDGSVQLYYHSAGWFSLDGVCFW